MSRGNQPSAWSVGLWSWVGVAGVAGGGGGTTYASLQPILNPKSIRLALGR